MLDGTVIIVIVPLLSPRTWPSCHVVPYPLMFPLVNKKKQQQPPALDFANLCMNSPCSRSERTQESLPENIRAVQQTLPLCVCLFPVDEVAHFYACK